MSRWVALAIASLVAGVALVAAVVMSGKDDDAGSKTPSTECEQAYADGLGNAATSERASWIADCEAEMDD